MNGGLGRAVSAEEQRHTVKRERIRPIRGYPEPGIGVWSFGENNEVDCAFEAARVWAWGVVGVGFTRKDCVRKGKVCVAMSIVIPTRQDNVAVCIALGVLLLSVVLLPIVEACLQRIRADRAWKSIEKQRSVDVTKYNMISEAMGDRGRWDTARVVTLMLAAFHVSTWGLELSLDLALNKDGPVDLLNRPPPVVLRAEVVDPAHNLTDWIVLPHEQPREGGTLKNFNGKLDDGNASASYRVGGSIIHGKTLFASWSKQSARIESGLFYDRLDGRASVEGLNCSEPSRKGALYVGAFSDATRKWGYVTECEGGPRLVGGNSTVPTSPPTILLNSSEGIVHMIVEEEASYPSFLYSVWAPVEITPEMTYLDHVFYVSSTTRLVEAIVSGVANGILTGGGCIDLLSKFSISNTSYDLGGAARAFPFGEHPDSSSVETLDQVEPIVAGILVSDVGSVSAALLILVTGAAFIGCLFFRSSRTFDVYNRDKLIRAVSLPSGEGADGKPIALKIHARRSADDTFSIIISDDGVYRGCAGLCKRLTSKLRRRSEKVAARSSDGTVSLPGSFPASSREITCDGIRPTLEGERPTLCDVENHTPAEHCAPAHRVPMVVELIASPVPVPGPGLPGHGPRFTSLSRNVSGSSNGGPGLFEFEPLERATRNDTRAPSADIESQTTATE